MYEKSKFIKRKFTGTKTFAHLNPEHETLHYLQPITIMSHWHMTMCQGWPVAFTGGICHRYLPVNTGVDNTPKSGVYRHLLAFINISLISLQITLLTVLSTYYIMHGHHSTIFAAYA